MVEAVVELNRGKGLCVVREPLRLGDLPVIEPLAPVVVVPAAGEVNWRMKLRADLSMKMGYVGSLD